MTHHETHGKNCICHSCQPGRCEECANVRNVRKYGHALTQDGPKSHTCAQPRRAQR